MLGSAIRAAGNPDDPANAFASDFLQGVLQEVAPLPAPDLGVPTQPADTGTATGAPAAASQQFAQLRDSLMAQGLSAEQAAGQALQQLAQAGADTRTARGYFVPDEHHDAVLAQVRADWESPGEAPEPDPLPAPVTPDMPDDGLPEGTLPPVVVTGQRIHFVNEIASGIGGDLDSLYQEGKALASQGLQLAADGLSLLDVPVLQDYQGRIRDYLDQKAAAGGLSEAEMMVFGALYAANEALFPTNALDFTGGMGKAIGAAAEALRRGSKLGDVAEVVRTESRLLAQATAGHAGGEGYDGGHLIATLFGGAGEKINLVPQLSTVNRGEFRVMEAEWAKAVLAGQEVKVSVRPVYSGTLGTPDRIVVDSWLNGVRQTPRTFENKVDG